MNILKYHVMSIFKLTYYANKFTVFRHFVLFKSIRQIINKRLHLSLGARIPLTEKISTYQTLIKN